MIHAIFFKTVYTVYSLQCIKQYRYADTPCIVYMALPYMLWALLLCRAVLYKVFSIRSAGFPGDAVLKSPPANGRYRRDVGLIPGSGKDLWRKRQLPPGFLSEKFPWKGSLVSYSTGLERGAGQRL